MNNRLDYDIKQKYAYEINGIAENDSQFIIKNTEW